MGGGGSGGLSGLDAMLGGFAAAPSAPLARPAAPPSDSDDPFSGAFGAPSLQPQSSNGRNGVAQQRPAAPPGAAAFGSTNSSQGRPDPTGGLTREQLKMQRERETTDAMQATVRARARRLAPCARARPSARRFAPAAAAAIPQARALRPPRSPQVDKQREQRMAQEAERDEKRTIGTQVQAKVGALAHTRGTAHGARNPCPFHPALRRAASPPARTQARPIERPLMAAAR